MGKMRKKSRGRLEESGGTTTSNACGVPSRATPAVQTTCMAQKIGDVGVGAHMRLPLWLPGPRSQAKGCRDLPAAMDGKLEGACLDAVKCKDPSEVARPISGRSGRVLCSRHAGEHMRRLVGSSKSRAIAEIDDDLTCALDFGFATTTSGPSFVGVVGLAGNIARRSLVLSSMLWKLDPKAS